jgi:long-chain acyl-CoA synthetase
MNKKGIILSEKDGRKTVTGLGYYQNNPAKNFKEIVKCSLAKYRDKAAFMFKSGKEIVKKTYAEFAEEVDALGTALINSGLKNKRFAVIGENRYEWALSFFSVTCGAGIAVPLDKHLPEVEIDNLIKRGKVDVIFYSNHFQNEMMELSKKDTGIVRFICMDELSEDYPSNFTSIPLLIQQGKTLIADGNNTFIDAEINSEELSVLLFTSGTTSMSKGVMLNQRNICWDISAVAAVLKLYDNDVHLSILPLHHTFELSTGMIFMIQNGVTIAYCEGVKHIAKNLKEFKVTILIVVPAILEAIYKKMREGIKKSGKEKQIEIISRISGALQKIGIDLRRVFFKKILEQIGPGLRLAVSGAAPIDKEIITGFGMLGLNVIQGYGLTETSPVVAANNDFCNKAGTIGHPVKGIEVAIDNPDENDMGEIITKGQNVMMGYYEDDKATMEAIDSEGWFHTGDLGHIDNEGYISITGRAKSMIVLNNGKKAFPEEYELLLNNIPGVKDSFVWGNIAPDGDVQVCAKLVLNEAALIEKYGSIPEDSQLSDMLQKELKEINKDIPQYKIVRYFVISYEDLIKTTTLKIKRPVEYKRVMELLDKADTNMRKANGKNIDALTK